MANDAVSGPPLTCVTHYGGPTEKDLIANERGKLP